VKVGLNKLGGYRNEMTFVLTGNLIPMKERVIREQLAHLDATWTLARTNHLDSPVQEEAAALLHCVVRGPDPTAIGRSFSNAAVELALSSYPGFHLTTPPTEAAPYGVFAAAFVDATQVPQIAVLPDGRRVEIEPPAQTRELEDVAEAAVPTWTGQPTRHLLARSAGQGARPMARLEATPPGVLAVKLADVEAEQSPRQWPAAARSTSRTSATTRAASCWPVSASSCCVDPGKLRRIEFLELSARWRRGAPTSRSAPASSPGIGVVEGVECVINGSDPTVRGGASTRGR
jgi:hypothetical protein